MGANVEKVTSERFLPQINDKAKVAVT